MREMMGKVSVLLLPLRVRLEQLGVEKRDIHFFPLKKVDYIKGNQSKLVCGVVCHAVFHDQRLRCVHYSCQC